MYRFEIVIREISSGFILRVEDYTTTEMFFETKAEALKEAHLLIESLEKYGV